MNEPHAVSSHAEQKRTLAGMPPQGWVVLAGIAAAGALIGFAQGRGWFGAPQVRLILLSAVAIGAVGSAAALFRRGALRGRLSAGVQEYGGGAYGLVGFGTLLYLEGLTIARDVASAGSLADLLDRQLWQWFVGFSAESIVNAVRAAIWPLYWFQVGGFTALILLSGCAWLALQLARVLRAAD